MSTPRRRLVRPPSAPVGPGPREQFRLEKLRTRLERERNTLARWFNRLKRSFHAVEKSQQRIARLERQSVQRQE